MNWSLGEKAKVSFSMSGKINRKKITNTQGIKDAMVWWSVPRPVHCKGREACLHSGRAEYKIRPGA